MASVDAPIRAGLIYQQRELASRLKQTLTEAGIGINAEFDVEGLRTAVLSAHDIEVYIVNLEPEIEDHLDEVTDLLENAEMPVVFNDAGVSGDLSGWDQARWARHLAAKIRKGRSNLPPRPVDAQAIPMPTRVVAAVATPASAAPIADLPPVVEKLAELAPIEEIADQSFATELPSAAVDVQQDIDAVESIAEGMVTSTIADAGAALEFEEIDEDVLDTLDLLGHGDEGGFLPSKSEAEIDRSVPGSSLSAPVEVNFELPDFDFPSEPVASETAEKFEDLPFAADLANDLDETASIETSGGVEAWHLESESDVADFADLLDPETAAGEVGRADNTSADGELVELIDSGTEAGPAAFTQTGKDSTWELDQLDELAIDDLTVGDDLDVLGDEFADIGALSTDLEQIDADDEQIEDWQSDLAELSQELPSETARSAVHDDADADFGVLDIDFEVPDGPAEDGLVDLDALLATPPAATPEPELPAESKPVAAFENDLEELPDLSAWSLEPVEGEEVAPTASAPVARVPEKKTDSPSVKVEDSAFNLAELSFSLDDLGLVPMDEDAESEVPAESQGKAPAAASFGIDFLSVDLGGGSQTPTKEIPVVAAPPAQSTKPAAQLDGPKRIVVLGASIGGPDSIRSFLSKLHTGLHAAFILVQHMGAEFLDLMAQQLDRVSPLSVHLARHGQLVREGEVLIAPVGKRLRIDAEGKVDLSEDAGQTAYSPSIDQVLVDSLERWGGGRLLVIIFSGMASDAVQGSKQLAAAGSPIWAQDPASCVISSMVDGVVAAKVVSFVGSPEQLAEQANRLLA